MKTLKALFLCLLCLTLTLTLGATLIHAQDETPVDGGVLRTPASWPRHYNVFQITSGRQSSIFRLIYNGLIRINYTIDGYVNDLAESYETSDDLTEYTFHLRDGVTWHDGTPFSVEDVEFTFTQALNPATGSVWQVRLAYIQGAAAFSSGEAESVSGIQVVDENTIKFVLDAPNITFLDTVALISIAPKHILEGVDPATFAEAPQFLSQPIGTGAFKFVRQSENEIVEFERNEQYFGGVPHLERIVMPILDADTALAAFERGDVETVALGSPEAIQRAQSLPNTTVYVNPTLFLDSLFINVRNEYLADPRVRQAMLMAIDRETLANVVLAGTKTPVSQPTPVVHPWVELSPDLNAWAFDPEAARALLTEAGWDFDRVLRWTGQLAEPSTEMLVIQQMLAEVGIQTEFQLVADAAAQNEVRWVSKEWDLDYSGLQIGTDPDELTVRFQCGLEFPAGFSDGYCNPELDALMEQGRQSSDEAERRSLYQQVQVILNQELPVLPILNRIRYTAVSNRLHDPLLGVGYDAGHLTLYAPAQDWWLEPAS